MKDLRVLRRRYWQFPSLGNAEEESLHLFKWGTLHFDHLKDAPNGYAVYFRIHSLSTHHCKPSDFHDGQRYFVCELEIP